MNEHKLISLCSNLIARPSITPIDAGAIEIIESYLSEIGFITHKLIYGETTNLYAKIGNKTPNLSFAGHTDVVSPGDIQRWHTDPFRPQIIDHKLYGRGAVDMKSAICAFIIAAEEHISHNKHSTISFIITGDEEGSGANGTPKILNWLEERNERIDLCIVGEPTSNTILGDTIKIGRRGSITFTPTLIGQQGHVAYPHLAINPVTQLVQILNKLIATPLDTGNEFFQPSNLEVTSIDVGNTTCNLIPNQAKAQLNIRFNNLHTSQTLVQLIRKTISSVTQNYHLEFTNTAQPFITPPCTLSTNMSQAIQKTLGITPQLSTNGGTSDARYIKDICPVIEFGLLNSTAHKANENTAVQDIINLSKTYKCFIDLTFTTT